MEWILTRPAGPPPPSGDIDLVGAGATFPYPLYRQWFADYGAETGVRINYFSVGSGEGIRLLLEGGADFGATDRPLRAEEIARATCGPVVVPMVVGTVAVAYNIPGFTGDLQMDEAVLAGIYLGRITRWGDPALRALNPRAQLPPLAIRVVHRVHTSGTSEIFASYLATDADWRGAQSPVGIRWPVGSGAEGNEGVASEVRATIGAIGFLELSYARLSRLPVASLRNVAGAFVRPDSTSVATAAAELLTASTVDTITAGVGARARGAYPIVGVTRIVADRVLGDSIRGAHLIAFTRWALDEGARSASKLGFAPLPLDVVRQQQQRLDALRPGTCPRPTATP